MRKVLIGASAALVLLAGGLAAAALITAPSEVAAQETDTDSQTEPATSRLGTFVDEALEDLVTQGVITQDQAQAVREALVEAWNEREVEFGDRLRPFGWRIHRLIRFGLNTAAEEIGIETSELARLMRGEHQSIAEVATDHGVDSQTVIDALVADASAKVDQIAAERDLDPERVAALKAALPELAERFVEFEPPEALDFPRPFAPWFDGTLDSEFDLKFDINLTSRA